MMSDSFVDSTMNMLKGLNSEIARIQATAKKTLAGFDKVINSIRDLNRGITMRFRTLNNELTASRIDFLRGVLNAPEMPTPDLGGAPVLVMKNDQPVEPRKDEPPAAGGGLSLTDVLGALAGMGLAKDIIAWMPKVAAFFTTTLGGAFLAAAGGGLVALAGAMFAAAGLGDLIENWLGIKKRLADLENTVEYQEMRSQQQKAAEKAAGGPGGPQGRADRMQQRANIIKKFDLKMGDLSQDPNNINIMVHKDGRKFDLTTGEVVPGTASSTPNYSPRATTPTVSNATSPTSRRKANLPQITQSSETTGAPTATNGSNFTPRPTTERNFTPRTATPLPVATPTAEAAPAGAPTRRSLKGALEKSLPVKPLTEVKDQGGGADIDNKGMQPDIVAEKPTSLSMAPENSKNSLLSVDSAERMIDTKVIQMAEIIRRQSTNRTVSNQPIVMNNTSTSNSSSTEGGEGNNVAGQNFPLSAINPHIQEFLAKQNVQYQ
jgi:hypothetical protein